MKKNNADKKKKLGEGLTDMNMLGKGSSTKLYLQPWNVS